MKRKILAMVIFSCMLLSYSGIIVSAEDYELSLALYRRRYTSAARG